MAQTFVSLCCTTPVSWISLTAAFGLFALALKAWPRRVPVRVRARRDRR
jgi:hypothetical protein